MSSPLTTIIWLRSVQKVNIIHKATLQVIAMTPNLWHMGQMAAENLLDFITRRREELDRLEAPHSEAIDKIKAEREQLRRAAMAAGIEAHPDSSKEGARQTRRFGKMTIKEGVVAVLDEHPNGMPALDILREINLRYGWAYARESLSPQLSRLKQEGHIDLTGRIWHLPGQKIEPSDNNLFNEELSEGSKPVSEAQGVKAAPGGGG